MNADDSSVLLASQGDLSGSNLFAYGDNNPLMNSDPSGLYSIPAWIVASAIDLAMAISNMAVEGAFTATALTFGGY